MPRLRDLQQRMFRAITGAHAGDATPFDDLVRGHGPLGAEQRVGIYAGMYCARLMDALAEDYPRVATVLGADAFAAAAHGYVAAHPSTQPSLRWFGAGLAAFLATHPIERQPGYVADLARLEWARLAVFDAPDAEPLDLEALRRVPADAWPAMRLQAVPAIEVLEVAWPVHRIWEAAAPTTDWAPENLWLRIWRHGDQVFQAPMDPTERQALHGIRAGDDFAAMCAGIAKTADVEDVAATAAGLVLRWIEDGVLRRPAAE